MSLRQGRDGGAGADGALLEVRDLSVHFPVNRGILQRPVGVVRAVDKISFRVQRGKTVGLVGESGCGKTTTGRAILQLCRPTAGEVIFDGQDLSNLRGTELRRVRRNLQMIFQDPFASLNPRMTVSNIVAEPLQIHNLFANRRQRRDRVAELLSVVGLNPAYTDRYPYEFSGGQRQRIGIARALAAEPDLIVCDEPVSALDVSIQAQIINLLQGLQDRFGLAYLFIAHDLSVVRHISDFVTVMYLGKLVEQATRTELYENPLHPYTKALLSAVPVPDPEVEAQRHRIILTGDVPSPLNLPSGCRFHPRCPWAEAICSQEQPTDSDAGSGHLVQCHLWKEIADGKQPAKTGGHQTSSG